MTASWNRWQQIVFVLVRECRFPLLQLFSINIREHAAEHLNSNGLKWFKNLASQLTSMCSASFSCFCSCWMSLSRFSTSFSRSCISWWTFPCFCATFISSWNSPSLCTSSSRICGGIRRNHTATGRQGLGRDTSNDTSPYLGVLARLG